MKDLRAHIIAAKVNREIDPEIAATASEFLLDLETVLSWKGDPGEDVLLDQYAPR